MTAVTAALPRILVIEDEDRIRRMLEKGLRRAGFEPIGVADGASGISRAMDVPVDLILLDLGLPDIDGLEVMERIRRRGVPTPVVVLSAREAVDDKVTALASGAADYVTKPFSFEELVARIRLRLGEALAPAASDGPPATVTGAVAAPATSDGRFATDTGAAAAPATAEVPPRHDRRRILVIEDEHRIGLFLAKGLTAQGFEAVVSEDGEVGAFLATTEPFDVVLLDLGLPGADGFEVLGRLRSDVPSLPVILLTGRDDPAVRRRAYDRGAAAFVTKPLVSNDLRQAIEQVLARGTAPPPP